MFTIDSCCDNYPIIFFYDDVQQQNSSIKTSSLCTVCVCVFVCVRSEMLVQPQHRVEEAVGLCVHSGQRMSVFWKPQQPDR